MTHLFRVLLLSAISIVILGGCGVGGVSPPSRYYLLAADPTLAQTDNRVPEPTSIAVGPVTVPSYLDRMQIVTNRTPYRLDLAEFDTWAEPLDENVTRVLVENLSRLLGTDRVLAFEERRSAPIDFEIAVDIERMGSSGKSADLVARWTLSRTSERQHLLTRRSRLQTPLADGEFDTLVKALSQNVADLSREIARAIEQSVR